MALPLQTVEALTDESGQLIGIMYTVENLGTFSRIDGQWKLSGADFRADAETVTADETIVSTPIDYEKAPELVARFDEGQLLTAKDLIPYEKLEN